MVRYNITQHLVKIYTNFGWVNATFVNRFRFSAAIKWNPTSRAQSSSGFGTLY